MIPTIMKIVLQKFGELQFIEQVTKSGFDISEYVGDLGHPSC